MKFKFRAEMPIDATRIKTALQTSLLLWKETTVFLQGGIKVDDVEVEFETDENGPTLDEIRKVMDDIVDCHIAKQTLNYLESYTGERYYHDTPPNIMPSNIERLEKEANDSSTTFNRSK